MPPALPSSSSRSTRRAPMRSGPDTPAFNALAASRPAVPAGVRHGAADAAVARVDDDRALSGRALACTRTARYVSTDAPLLAERLRERGYRTAAFVSAFALARRFGFARGFELYDEDFGADRAERTAKETTDRALAFLGARRPSSRCSCGSTTTILTIRTRRRSRSARGTRASRIAAKSRRWTNSSAASSRRSRKRGPAAIVDRRRSRRRTRRPRRGAARQSALPVDDARPARRCGTGRPPRDTTMRR